MLIFSTIVCAALPHEEESKPTRTPISAGSRDNEDMTIIAVSAAVVVAAIIILAVCCWLWRRNYQKVKNPPPPAVRFDLTPRVVVEESIDFVVPPLQSPRTLKAGAANFELGSSEQRLQKNLYEPIAREYRPPSVGFSLEHERESRSLIVRLNGAKDIAPSKIGVNPVVKVTLLPEKVKFISRVAKDTTRPVFGDVFNFELSEGVSLELCSLKFTLYDQDKLGRRVLVGKALQPLQRTLHQGERWLPLDVQKPSEQSYGEVTIQLEQTETAFICSVVSLRGLPKDLLVYIKMGVYLNHRPYRKIRSGSFQALGGVKELSERLEISRSDLSTMDLSNLQLIVSLCGRKKRLAKCHIGPKSSVEGIEQWAEMLNKGRAVRAHRFLPG